MRIESIVGRKQPYRKVQGIAAALLPFEMNGRVAVEAFQNHLRATHSAGLMNAVNMDTGYVNLLCEAETLDVLRWTREALGGNVPFVAGAYIEGQDGDVVTLYRKQMDAIVVHGGIPILFQTSRLHGKPSAEKAAVYAAASRGYSQVLAFELGSMFAPSGTGCGPPVIPRTMRCRTRCNISEILPFAIQFRRTNIRRRCFCNLREEFRLA